MLESHRGDDLATLLSKTTVRVQLPEEWKDFLTEKESHTLMATERRRFMRRLLRIEAVLLVRHELRKQTAPAELHHIYLRDVSRTGVSFLHAHELFPGDQVAIRTPTSWINLSVTRCLRWNDHCYVVGGIYTAAETS